MTFSEGVQGKLRQMLWALLVLLSLPVMAVDFGTIAVRVGQHTDYSRAVFDLPREVPYSVRTDGSTLTIRIEAGFDADLGAIRRGVLRGMAAPSISRDGDITTVTVTMPAGAGPRHFRSGSSIVLDVMDVAPASVVSGQSVAPASAAERNAPSRPQPTPPAETPREEPATTPTPSTETPAFEGRSADYPRLQPAFRALAEGGVQLALPITAPDVGLAFFKRSTEAWLVVDRPFAVDADALVRGSQGVVTSVARVDHPDATILRLGLEGDPSLSVMRDGAGWQLSFKPLRTAPRFPLKPIKRIDTPAGQQIFIASGAAGRRIAVTDPLIGDDLVIVPLVEGGQGMAEAFRYTVAEVGETAQGIVVVPYSDEVRVERFRDGVAVMSGDARYAEGDAARDQALRRLIDFNAWRQGEVEDYYEVRTRLLYALSLRPTDDRNEARWDLARFYLAHGRATEALAILEMMLDEDPALSGNGEYLAVRGVANVKKGRLQAADADLSNDSLTAEQDVSLWKVLVDEGLNRPERALADYRRGVDVLGPYDDRDKADIQLAVIRAAMKTGDMDLAKRELELLGGVALTDRQLSERVLLSARIDEQEGREEDALIAYDSLAMAPQRGIGAEARHVRAAHDIRKGILSGTEAIETLEQLRYAWRGNGLEFDLLNELADLYFAAGRYEEGLERLRVGVTYFPDRAREARMSAKMSQVFRRLYLEGEADRMDPVAAIGLFYKFRELTPLGADGDAMIRRLADRLVALDLIDQAAELLEYQVKVRTEGAPRAAIASRLAKLYLLNSDPERALGTLRATREPQLPVEIELDRRLVEARALTELGRYEEAEVLIEEDNDRASNLLRADIYWQSKDWPKMVDAGLKLLEGKGTGGEPLEPGDRVQLLRLAIAMTFDENKTGLAVLRRRFAEDMKQGEFSNAFALLTGPQDLSGGEISQIVSQIANVSSLQSFLKDYRNDFSGD
ncbi:tetratricopeptide repeat protein [Gimibacter soli]|uniref:Tetratricopeptide repeat protein n=1 Tax=Gimibacter soli TaxID=3024400 RepID=A0AAF0BKJ3_9PROT|nr:hypothetical protein [Gimibacter soli]WCL53027.1 hypothetical protein PH603_10800 [Gimibacter soli]